MKIGERYGGLIFALGQCLLATLCIQDAYCDEQAANGKVYWFASAGYENNKVEAFWETDLASTNNVLRYDRDESIPVASLGLGYVFVNRDALHLSAEFVYDYAAFNENYVPDNQSWANITHDRQYVASLQAVIGRKFSEKLAYLLVGGSYSDHSYGVSFGDSAGWEDHDFAGLRLGGGLLVPLNEQLQLRFEYSRDQFSMDQDFKDNAKSAKDVDRDKLSIGFIYSF